MSSGRWGGRAPLFGGSRRRLAGAAARPAPRAPHARAAAQADPGVLGTERTAACPSMDALGRRPGGARCSSAAVSRAMLGAREPSARERRTPPRTCACSRVARQPERGGARERARAYTALKAATPELGAALRRVEILESIRTNLAQVRAAHGPGADRGGAGAPRSRSARWTSPCSSWTSPATRGCSERFDLDRVNAVVERYFGAFLDEILATGGDVNETAGDGLMVIFRGRRPVRSRARRGATRAQGILRRAHAINASSELSVGEPIRLHVGVNSGAAAVGATKIEGAARDALDVYGLWRGDQRRRAAGRARRR